MPNYIRAALPNILGLLQGRIEFGPGLNIVSGENGTFKTKLLQAMRGGATEPSVVGAELRIQAISPKRNSDRRAAEGILQHFRQQNRTWEGTLVERLGSQINDTTFDNYPSLGELFYLLFEHRCKDGGDRKNHMTALVTDLDAVIQSVFPHYALLAVWDDALGAPRIRVQKNETIEFPIEALSLGEQEVLSLITNIHGARDRIDVYLIDEPEVHLNWHLEERLFAFLADFCERYGKQIIVVTHSRVIFKARFLPSVQFLYWEAGRINWRQELSKEQRQRLAGDAIEIVALGDFTKPTLFVEDTAHADTIASLASIRGKDINVSECGNSANVKSLFIYQKTQGRWPRAMFVIDGDNMGNPFPGDVQFIHLPYYCIENALLHPEMLGLAFGKDISTINQIVVDAIVAQRDRIFAKNKFFEFLINSISPAHVSFEALRVFDCSLILDEVATRLGSTRLALIPLYLRKVSELERLTEIFPAALLEHIEGVAASQAVSATSYQLGLGT